MTRLLVECTYVFEHPKVNSGIQRVVRNVIRELPEADETVECIPVAMLDGTLYQVHSLRRWTRGHIRRWYACAS